MQWWCSAQGVPWTWSWQAYPGVWVFLALIALGYRRILRKHPPAAGAESARRRRVASFIAGLIFLWLSLDWPIGALGAGYLASAHMLQFLLMALIAPPMLLFGIPEEAYQALAERPAAGRALRALTHPIIALLIFNILIIVTHVPTVTDTLMASQIGSFVIDLTWIIAAIVFWWPVIVPFPERSWMHPLLKVGYIGAQLILGKPVFVYLTFSEYPVYAVYELAPRVHGFTATADQQTAGLMMEVVGALILFAASSIVFLSWGMREQKADGKVTAENVSDTSDSKA